MLLALVALAAACRTAEPPRTEAAADTIPALPAGQFVPEYGPATPLFANFREGLIAHRLLDTTATRLNRWLVLPEKITLATAHCDEPNAKYEPSSRTVTLCYELFRALSERFATKTGGEYLVAGTLMFAMMHELGHALIDVLRLPTTGREEDAVDQLATLLLLRQGAAGDSLAFGAVGWFVTNAQTNRFDEIALADDHGLDQQRVYNIICWIYGRDPSRYPEVLRDGLLPEHRADRCPAEYQRLTDSWGRLLAPHERAPLQ
ncbi:MAG: hypothetical protein HOP28_03855 [Gemmatimonadales bacterium]|nr:hypothetical protein [Gemmatimonadales bacterium]